MQFFRRRTKGRSQAAIEDIRKVIRENPVFVELSSEEFSSMINKLEENRFGVCTVYLPPEAVTYKRLSIPKWFFFKEYFWASVPLVITSELSKQIRVSVLEQYPSVKKRGGARKTLIRSEKHDKTDSDLLDKVRAAIEGAKKD